MRVCWISTLLLGLFHSALIPSSKGLEGEKKIGTDDVYKPRKWSQVRDGPYRMVVSSRDQESDETQLDSRKGTRNRQGHNQNISDDKEPKNDAARDSSDGAKDGAAGDDDSVNKPEKGTPARIQNDAEGVPKSRGGERRKYKIKVDHAENASLLQDNFEKNDKSTQRTVKLARKRERILINENFRKAHRVSVPEGYFSTPNPSTLSYKIYNHFRPIERGIPRESIIPFYDFGKKLSTGKTPSGINSIEGSSTPGLGGYEITTHREDNEPYHGDMDMTVAKLKPVERNTAPRVWPPLKNPEITAYFKTSTANSDEEIRFQSTTPLTEVETKSIVTTTQSATSTLPSTDPTITTIPTVLPPEQSDLQTNESKSKTNVMPSRQTSTTEIPLPVEIFSTDNNRTLESLKELPSTPENVSNFTQLPRPSPTAKILSTAVVTSVSVKETYRHPRIKGINSPDVETTSRNKTVLNSQSNKPFVNRNTTANITSTNQPNKVESAAANIAPSTHRPTLERHFINRTNALYKNNTIQPTTIRPKFRSNIEFHTFATKVPTSTTTHKPVNRSLYSTFQREQHKNKYVSLQHHKNDNTTKPQLVSNRTNDNNSSAKSDDKSLLSAGENKTKMYLTIRSRLPNQSATFRSTFRRNGTKAVPPVLRVIATPSSYIEVPRIISRLVLNSSSTTQTPTTEIESIVINNPNMPVSIETQHENHSIDPSTEQRTEISPDDTISTERNVQTPKTRPKNENSPKIPDNLREVRMNNHRMPSQEITTEENAEEELTTVYSFHSQETTTETPENPSPTQPIKYYSKDPVNIVTVAQRPGQSKPGLSWVHLGQKNRTRLHDSAVEVAYSSGFGIAAYVLAALGVIPLILGGFVLLRQILIKSKKKMLDESEYSSEYNRTPLPAKLPRIPSHAANWEGDKATSSLSPVQISSNQGNVPHQNNIAPNQHQSNQHQSNQHPPAQEQLQHGKWEFPRDKLRLQTLLGEGNFGQVWKAEADDISGHEGLTRLVAVKTVKEGSGGREREDLLRELAIMKELGSHPNVVTLLGCCTDREPFLLIMEYVMYGKMLTFLREHRTRAHYFNFSDLNSALVSRDLTVFAYCVARGMEFLVSKGIIHRDLAARNILVDHNKLCKIADFGMSRNVHDSGEIYEQRPNRGALPIRWMAPEALHCSIFTNKSDVWSFGILVWEIITLGCTPYQTMGAREVMRRVREGYRLERPVHCTQDLYKVITRCWAADPSKRPTFTELKHDLAALLSDPQTNGACVDLDALTEEMSSHSC